MKTFKIIFRIIACLIFCTFLFVGYKVLNSVFISHIDTVLDVVNTEEEKYIKYYNEFMNREEISENDYRAFIDGVNNFLIEDYERNKKLYSSQRTIITMIWFDGFHTFLAVQPQNITGNPTSRSPRTSWSPPTSAAWTTPPGPRK